MLSFNRSSVSNHEAEIKLNPNVYFFLLKLAKAPSADLSGTPCHLTRTQMMWDHCFPDAAVALIRMHCCHSSASPPPTQDPVYEQAESRHK